MKCPHCGKAPYPIKNEDGTINWKNVFRIDFLSLIMVIGILCLLFGFKQIQEQCFIFLENPCETAKDAGCKVELDAYGDILAKEKYAIPSGSLQEYP